ncbi:3-phosphoshikimate 1-carboxyvinyltransferase [Vagococcus intermedius]|uniref:3-phosphoshikimate 1-carboxyvinyltransferase n=1 Tax=Vagococcus intermedius TaxID=2991418 RepID=A0AAF0I797_9ENTE|nr:3-phosphoshikimate 1-carboxyvinyltransferase [Vagococcus intermedius]WEG74158.1 3-phosphoshikimate 1-carboxyvinyltransferase [Vagococcus intermedius]WEG76238.1 3-phosphoshikimate 1-carboxyvinyltransferase [Vagococcus intermedius]
MKLITNQRQLTGLIKVPGDKSISHRSLMFGALAEGKTEIHGFLPGEDCLATKKLCASLGVVIEEKDTVITIYGKAGRFKNPSQPIDIGNSGTTMRLGLGLLAGAGVEATLYGDDSLNHRPMARVMTPLNSMGARVSGDSGTEYAPIKIKKSQPLDGISYDMPVASAQVKSAILFAALQTKGETLIKERIATRNHTEEMIKQFGGQIEVFDNQIRIIGPQQLLGQRIEIPGDISSAAFFIAGALLTSDSQVCLENVGLNPSRTGLLDVLNAMGADIEKINIDPHNQLGDLVVRSSRLTGTVVEGEIIPRLIDELPILALVATQAQGTTIIRDAEELKVKETNRIDATASELAKLGADITPTEDGLIINGPTPLKPATVSSHGDHRLGMMLAIASLLVKEGTVTLEGSEAISVSYPRFFEDLNTLLVKDF